MTVVIKIRHFAKLLAIFVWATFSVCACFQAYASNTENTIDLGEQRPESLKLPSFYTELNYPELKRLRSNPGKFRGSARARFVGFTRPGKPDSKEGYLSALWLNDTAINYLVRNHWKKIGASDNPFVMHVALLTAHAFNLEQFAVFLPNHPNIYQQIAANLVFKQTGLITPHILPAKMRFNGEDVPLVILRETLTSTALEKRGLYNIAPVQPESYANGETRVYASPQNHRHKLMRTNQTTNIQNIILAKKLLQTAFKKPLLAPYTIDTASYGALAAAVDVFAIPPDYIKQHLEFTLDTSGTRVTPVLFDMPPEKILFEHSGTTPPSCKLDFVAKLAQNPVFKKNYNQAVEKLENLLSAPQSAMVDTNGRTIWPVAQYKQIAAAFVPPNTTTKAARLIDKNQNSAVCPTTLAPKTTATLASFSARLEQDKEKPVLVFTNNLKEPGELLQISWLKEGRFKIINPSTHPDIFPKTIHPTSITGQTVLTLENGIVPANGNVQAFIKHANGKTGFYKIYNDPGVFNTTPFVCYDSPPKHMPEFITVDEQNNILAVKPGTWEASKYIDIPKGWTLEILQNTSINFSEHSGIRGCGSLHIKGTAENPVTLTQENNDSQWNGILLIADNPTADNARNLAIFKHAVISNAIPHTDSGWAAKAPLYFYGYGIDIQDTELSFLKGQAGLIAEKSRILMDNVALFKSGQNGFVFKNSSARINELTAKHVAPVKNAKHKQGIALFNSTAEITNSQFYDVICESISAYKNSVVTLRNIKAQYSCTIALAATGSTVTIDKSQSSYLYSHALKALGHKKGYGGAKLVATDVKIENTARQEYAHREATLLLDNISYTKKWVELPE